MCALDGPRARKLRALRGKEIRQLPDASRRNARDAAGPFRRLGRRAVRILAFQIGTETVEAHRVLLHEIAVPAIHHQQMVAHGQEERRIRVRDDWHPFRVHHLIGRGALRIDGNALHAGFSDGLPVREHLVIGHRVFDTVVLVRVAADEHQHLGVLGHLFPAGLGRIHLQIAQNQRHDDLACTGRIVTRCHRRTAQQVEETPLQHIGSENARVRPSAIRRAEAALVAVLLDRVQNGLGREPQRHIPAHLHERFLAPQCRLRLARAKTFQIRLAHHGPCNARLVISPGNNPFRQHRGGALVRGLRHHLFQPAVLHRADERAVVRGVRHLPRETGRARGARRRCLGSGFCASSPFGSFGRQRILQRARQQAACGQSRSARGARLQPLPSCGAHGACPNCYERGRAALTITKEQDWQKVVKPRIICKHARLLTRVNEIKGALYNQKSPSADGFKGAIRYLL